MDWGEAEAILDGHPGTVQFFELRLNYSRKVFARAYPAQKQEAFFDAHVAAFHYLGGVVESVLRVRVTYALPNMFGGLGRAFGIPGEPWAVTGEATARWEGWQ